MFTSEMLTDRRTDRQTDRRTDRQTDGRTDRRTDQSNSRVGYTQPAQIWKQSDKDFLSYRENDEVSADAAYRRLNHSIYNFVQETSDRI